MASGDHRRSAAPSERARVRRVPRRAVYGRGTVEQILDEALVSHLGVTRDGAPLVIPTLHARAGDAVYIHGSSASISLRALRDGLPACLTTTIVDGIVLARSALHHSVNYRSVVLHGRAHPLETEAEKLAALEAFTERLVPGRWGEVRPPTGRELKATSVLALSLDEASAKVRTGPPIDDAPDYELDCWAGVVPFALAAGEPVPDPQLRAGIAVSAAVHGLVASHALP